MGIWGRYQQNNYWRDTRCVTTKHLLHRHEPYTNNKNSERSLSAQCVWKPQSRSVLKNFSFYPMHRVTCAWQCMKCISCITKHSCSVPQCQNDALRVHYMCSYLHPAQAFSWSGLELLLVLAQHYSKANMIYMNFRWVQNTSMSSTAEQHLKVCCLHNK